MARECAVALRLDQDGNAGPLTCNGRHVNVEAWDYFARLHPPIMRLARHETVCQVAKYIGAARLLSPPLSDSAFELANVYNGWRVPAGLAAHILVGNPYHDTCTSEIGSRG